MRFDPISSAALTALLLAGCAAGSAGYVPREGGPVQDSVVVDADGGVAGPEQGPPCGPAGCEDNRPCTTDTCVGGSCVFDVKPGFCLIQGACRAASVKQPGAACGVCRPAIAAKAWSDDPSLCGDDGRSCTAASCSQGQCSHPVKSGYCLIGGTCYNQGQAQPQNPCRVCDNATAPKAWTPRSEGAPCPSGACVNGSCCSGCRSGSACHPGSTTAQCGKGGQPCVACAAGQTCAAGSCSSGSVQTLNVGPYGKTYSSASHTRGFWFTAPQNFTIVGLRVPTDVGTEVQSVEVLRLNVAPPAFTASTTSFTSLHYSKGVAGTGWIKVNIPFQSGQIVGILGGRGTATMKSSYAASPTFTSAINGKSVVLKRLLLQKNLYQQQADAVSSAASEFGRVELQYLPN